MKKVLTLTLITLLSFASTCFAGYEASSKFKYGTDNEIRFDEITYQQIKQVQPDLKGTDDTFKRSLFFTLENTSKDTIYFIDAMSPMVLLKDGNDNNIVFTDKDGDPQIISWAITNKKMLLLNPGDKVTLYIAPVDKYVDFQAKNIARLRVSIDVKPAKYNYETGGIDVPEQGTILEVLNIRR